MYRRWSGDRHSNRVWLVTLTGATSSENGWHLGTPNLALIIALFVAMRHGVALGYSGPRINDDHDVHKMM